MEALKPCPLCGGKAEIWRAHEENPKRKAWIACADRCLVLTKEYDTDEQAIAAWNRRADPRPAAQPGVVKGLEWEESRNAAARSALLAAKSKGRG